MGGAVPRRGTLRRGFRVVLRARDPDPRGIRRLVARGQAAGRGSGSRSGGVGSRFVQCGSVLAAGRPRRRAGAAVGGSGARDRAIRRRVQGRRRAGQDRVQGLLEQPCDDGPAPSPGAGRLGGERLRLVGPDAADDLLESRGAGVRGACSTGAAPGRGAASCTAGRRLMDPADAHLDPAAPAAALTTMAIRRSTDGSAGACTGRPPSRWSGPRPGCTGSGHWYRSRRNPPPLRAGRP